MNYIEISEGLSIKVDEIEAISVSEDKLTSIVHTHHNSYSSTFPYSVLLQLIEGSKEDKDNVKMQELNILKTLGTFAG